MLFSPLIKDQTAILVALQRENCFVVRCPKELLYSHNSQKWLWCLSHILYTRLPSSVAAIFCSALWNWTHLRSMTQCANNFRHALHQNTMSLLHNGWYTVTTLWYTVTLLSANDSNVPFYPAGFCSHQDVWNSPNQFISKSPKVYI